MSYEIVGTKQELFDKIVRRMADQNWAQSTNAEGGTCRYRGVKGRVCAAGALIPDKEYRLAMEKKLFDELVEHGLLACAEASFVRQCQTAHDCSEIHIHGMKSAFVDLAAKYALSTEVLDSL